MVENRELKYECWGKTSTLKLHLKWYYAKRNENKKKGKNTKRCMRKKKEWKREKKIPF